MLRETLCLRVFVATSSSPVINAGVLLFPPWQDRAEPVAALRIVRRAANLAEGLPANAFKVGEPRFVGEVVTRAVFDQFAVGKLILPFDMKGLTPERITPFNLDSCAPIHSLSLLPLQPSSVI